MRPGPDRRGIRALRALRTIPTTSTGCEYCRAEPDIERLHWRMLRGRDHRGNSGDDTHRDHRPSRYSRERARSLHRIANEGEIVHRPRVERGRLWSGCAMQRCYRGHESNLGIGPKTVKYFAVQSKPTVHSRLTCYPRAIGPGNGSLAGKLCSTILSSRRSSIAV